MDIEEVVLDYQKFFTTFKRFSLSIPSRLVSMVSDCVNPMEARKIEKAMDDEVKRMLNAFVVAGKTADPEDEPAPAKKTKKKAKDEET